MQNGFKLTLLFRSFLIKYQNLTCYRQILFLLSKSILIRQRRQINYLTTKQSLNNYMLSNTKQQQHSPHKIGMNIFSPRVQTQRFRNFSQFPSTTKNNPTYKQFQPASLYPNKKILILDDSIVDNSPSMSQQCYSPYSANHKQSSKKRVQPSNPFQEILIEYDTPDFNMTLPFVDEFSKIELKSPTFSDVFNLSEQKSPKVIVNSRQKFFLTTKKMSECGTNYLLDKSYTKEQDSKLRLNEKKSNKCYLDDDNQNFASPIKLLKKTTLKQPSLVLQKQEYPQNEGSSQSYKLRNHFNPSTPKINKIPFDINQKSKVSVSSKQKVQDQSSNLSNPEAERRSLKPYITNTNEIKLNKSPILYQRNFELFDNMSTKRFKDSSIKNSQPQQKYKFTPYKKISIKKLQLEEQLQQIYNGKFKLNRTMRF